MSFKVPPNQNHSVINSGMEKANMRPSVAKGITITKAESGTVSMKPGWRPVGSLASLFQCMEWHRDRGVLMLQSKSE